ncbi:hypothetical protein GS03_02334 [Flavobacterium sangjuense]|uniref:Uncharacterized protein n=1 Tax=Flavobacterium sangjuense TaxID=2518177 RepID=A0A4P7PXL9_9FLAO|nr:hypothetical protein GS03_02334 [Flavobacterium sangjuense]
MRDKVIKYKKPIVITSGIIILNLMFGLDIRFTIINLLWLLV